MEINKCKNNEMDILTPLIIFYDLLSSDQQTQLCKIYWEWVCTQDSAIGTAPSDYCGIPHHLVTKTNSGMGKKPLVLFAIPIPLSIHKDFHQPPTSWEGSGNKYVEHKYGVDLQDILGRLHAEFGKDCRQTLFEIAENNKENNYDKMSKLRIK